MKKFLALIIVFLLIFAQGCELTNTGNVTSDFEVHFIDVGQADSALVISNGKTMLIDGGNVEDSSLIVSYLKKLSIDYLDVMVCTHAHEDHIGGLLGALSYAKVNKVFAPKTEKESVLYEKFKHKVQEQNISIEHPKPFEEILLGESKILFMGPVLKDAEGNNSSIVLKVTYKNTSFLFTGDAETSEENDIIDAGLDMTADVIKLGHHGSKTSTSYRFLREAGAKYAVVSVGKDNDYGHPSEEVLSRVKDAGMTLYRTDMQGDIIFKSDGENIDVFPSKNKNVDMLADIKTQGEGFKGEYIGNKSSKKFHLPSCTGLPSEKNSVILKSYEEAIAKGYSPCKSCNP